MRRLFLYWIVIISALSPLSEARDGQLGTLAAPRFAATARRAETSIRIIQEQDTTVFDITSDSGVDQATIQRLTAEWPKNVRTRLHLAGLESFKAGNGDVDVEWSIATNGDHAVRVALWKARSQTILTPDSPYWTAVRIVGGGRKIPLKGGYFEISLPTTLFETNPREITLQWVDFYR